MRETPKLARLSLKWVVSRETSNIVAIAKPVRNPIRAGGKEHLRRAKGLQIPILEVDPGGRFASAPSAMQEEFERIKTAHRPKNRIKTTSLQPSSAESPSDHFDPAHRRRGIGRRESGARCVLTQIGCQDATHEIRPRPPNLEAFSVKPPAVSSTAKIAGDRLEQFTHRERLVQKVRRPRRLRQRCGGLKRHRSAAPGDHDDGQTRSTPL